MKKYLIPLLFLALFSSCRMEVKTKPGSGGKTLEILAVCNKSLFEKAVGDTLRAYFMQTQEALNQPEPLFTLANIPIATFEDSEMFQHMRNIIIVNIKNGLEPQFLIKKDAWASNQIVFQFDVSTQEEFFTLFAEKRELMLNAFYARERERIKRTFRSTENTEVSDRLLKTFGFKLVCPEGFRIVASKKDAVVLSKMTKHYDQTIIVYTYPYTSESFKLEDILKQRNMVTQKYIEGSLDSSYMTVEMLLPPIRKEVNLNSMYAVETRGLWKMVGDFMGGPFQNYVFLNEKSGQIVMIDVSLYSPRRPKRDLMMQLEGIAYSLEWKKEQPETAEAK